jgi:hypothetical protein
MKIDLLHYECSSTYENDYAYKRDLLSGIRRKKYPFLLLLYIAGHTHLPS